MEPRWLLTGLLYNGIRNQVQDWMIFEILPIVKVMIKLGRWETQATRAPPPCPASRRVCVVEQRSWAEVPLLTPTSHLEGVLPRVSSRRAWSECAEKVRTSHWGNTGEFPGDLEGWPIGTADYGAVFLRRPQQPGGRVMGQKGHQGTRGRLLRVLTPVSQMR